MGTPLERVKGVRGLEKVPYDSIFEIAMKQIIIKVLRAKEKNKRPMEIKKGVRVMKNFVD